MRVALEDPNTRERPRRLAVLGLGEGSGGVGGERTGRHSNWNRAECSARRCSVRASASLQSRGTQGHPGRCARPAADSAWTRGRQPARGKHTTATHGDSPAQPHTRPSLVVPRGAASQGGATYLNQLLERLQLVQITDGSDHTTYLNLLEALQLVGGDSVPLRRRLAIPLQRHLVRPRHAAAGAVEFAEVALGIGVPLRRKR